MTGIIDKLLGPKWRAEIARARAMFSLDLHADPNEAEMIAAAHRVSHETTLSPDEVFALLREGWSESDVRQAIDTAHRGGLSPSYVLSMMRKDDS